MTITELKSQSYDVVIDLQHNLKSRRITAALGISHIYRVNKLNINKWLYVNLKWNRMPDLHIVDRYLATCQSLEVVNDQVGLDYYLPENKVELYKSLEAKYQIRQQYICIAIGAAHHTKQIPIEQMVEVCDSLMDIQIILLGGPRDQSKGNQVQSQTMHKKVLNLAGKLSLTESAIVLDRSEVLMTPDTGLMHIAAALDVATVSLWGNTVPDFGMHPYPKSSLSKHAIIEVEDLSCRPCSKIGHKQCPKGHFRCMKDIKNQDIVEKIREFID